MRFGKPFLAALRESYGAGEQFLTSYLNYFEGSQKLTLRSLDDVEKLSETQKMWFFYAISTNQRGRDLMRAMEREKALAGRYLDIGCGFGGCLVAAAERKLDCTGIEIDGQRIDFARLNIADFGVEDRARVLHLDVLDRGIERQTGQFDFVSCNDVAEHVLDVERLFENLFKLLRPDGLAYLEIPNRYSIGAVASDGHFGLFGITLLERPEAESYYYQIYRHVYDVGHYLRLEQYLDLFERNGMSVRLVDSLYHPAQDLDAYPEAVRRLEERAAAFETGGGAPEAGLRGQVLDAYSEYRKRLEQEHRVAQRDHGLRPNFQETYLRDFWTFIARRK